MKNLGAIALKLPSSLQILRRRTPPSHESLPHEAEMQPRGSMGVNKYVDARRRTSMYTLNVDVRRRTATTSTHVDINPRLSTYVDVPLPTGVVLLSDFVMEFQWYEICYLTFNWTNGELPCVKSPTNFVCQR